MDDKEFVQQNFPCIELIPAKYDEDLWIVCVNGNQLGELSKNNEKTFWKQQRNVLDRQMIGKLSR